MMSKIYKKNAQNVYKLPFYRFSIFWLSVFISIAVTCYYLSKFTDFKYTNTVLLISIFASAALLIYKIFIILKRLFRTKSIFKYITEISSEKAVTKSLLETMTVNRLKDSPFVAVPRVRVFDNRPKNIIVEIEKLAGMYEIERLTEDINSSFRRSLKDYAVTSAIISDDGLTYSFSLENVGSDKTFRPRNLADLKTENYHLKLQEDLIINLADRPHIAVWGRTGSKKTTVLFSLILQLFQMNADIRFVDGKDEFSSFKSFYPSQKIASDADDVLNLLNEILDIVKVRQKIVADAVRQQEKIGLKASEIGLKPIVLIADEVGSIVALLDSKQKKQFISSMIAIIQRARSVGISVIISTQDPSVDVLPQSIRNQFSTRILLGSANAEIQRMAFGEVATIGSVEDFKGFYICDGLTNQPMKFFVADLYTYHLNDLNTFKKAYNTSNKNVV